MGTERRRAGRAIGFFLGVLVAAHSVPVSSAGASSPAEEVGARLRQVAEFWRQQDYRAAASLLEEIRSGALAQEEPQLRQAVSYNLACAYSLLDEPGKAVAALEEAVSAGYQDFRHLEEDTDLARIRNGSFRDSPA